MTVYPKSLASELNIKVDKLENNKKTAPVSTEGSTLISKINFILLFFPVLLVLGYVFLSNYTVSQNYAAELLKKKISQSELSNQTARTDVDLDQLMVFANKHGMVETKESDSLFEDGGVALR